ELDAGELGVDHPIDGVRAAAAETDDLDLGRFALLLELEHRVPPTCVRHRLLLVLCFWVSRLAGRARSELGVPGDIAVALALPPPSAYLRRAHRPTAEAAGPPVGPAIPRSARPRAPPLSRGRRRGRARRRWRRSGSGRRRRGR